MELIRPFCQLNKKDAHLTGGKGASLGEMTQAGIPVPPGFVVLADSFEQFIRETDLVQEIDTILHKVDHRQIHTVESASEQIRALILNAEMPKDIGTEIMKHFNQLKCKYVAVRSSATAEDGKDHAWAGQLESYLNTTEDQVLTKVKLCWSSLFTPRAIFYRFEKGLHSTKISVAVVVQKMVESEVSGIAFSVHPVTEDYNQLIIEAGFGLGEAIVSGSVTPDSYVVEKELRNILDINISTQDRALYRSEHASVEHGNNEWINIPEPKASSQVLTKAQILELSEIILKIEKHYGFPCDIEWAYEKGKFYIVQSRPITTLSNAVAGNSVSKEIQINIADYQKLFIFHGKVPFIISYDFVHSYTNLGGMAFGNNEFWSSYMLSKESKKSMEEGLEIYKSKESYHNLRNNIDEYFFEAEKLTKRISTGDFSQKDIEEYFKVTLQFRIAYQKLEFFYTDLAFEKQNEYPQITENFKTFEKLKLDGRGRLNQLFLVKDSQLSCVLSAIALKFKLDNQKIYTYSVPEILALFEGLVVSDDIIKQRDLAYLLYTDIGGQIIELRGEQVADFIDRVNRLDDNSVKSLKGKVAYKGKVTAKARVIKVSIDTYDQLSKFVDEMEQGEVLVAETTEPSIIAACKKASAIVTNQGGMMSHAAIVARELKIPCIVGTYRATEVIKTGDMVEVDAEKGSVRIL